MMKAKAPKEDPAVVAARNAEIARADKENLGAQQSVLDTLTKRYARRFGLVKGSGGNQSNIVGGLVALQAAAAGGGTGTGGVSAGSNGRGNPRAIIGGGSGFYDELR
jgi:hypothetical protein